MAASLDVPKPPHEFVVLFCTVLLSRELDEPFAKSRIQSGVLLPGLVSSQFDEVFVSTQGNVFHEHSVHGYRVKEPLIVSAAIGPLCGNGQA